MSTLTVSEARVQLEHLEKRGYGGAPFYIDHGGNGWSLVYRITLALNSQEKPVALIDSVER